MSATASEMTVGQRIRWARREAGYSQERLAETIGTTRQVIIRWERDKHLPNSSSRARLSEALDHAPEFFSDMEAAHLSDPFRGSDGEPSPRRARRNGGSEGVKDAA